jgi:membrane protein
VVAGIGLTYYFALDAEQDWVWVTPGSFVATILWLVGSLGFRFYAVNFGSFEATYGAIGGVILLLLWFYLTGLAIVIGPEINAEIERESPWAKASRGKAAGEKEKESALRPPGHIAKGRVCCDRIGGWIHIPGIAGNAVMRSTTRQLTP